MFNHITSIKYDWNLNLRLVSLLADKMSIRQSSNVNIIKAKELAIAILSRKLTVLFLVTKTDRMMTQCKIELSIFPNNQHAFIFNKALDLASPPGFFLNANNCCLDFSCLCCIVQSSIKKQTST